ncbi:MULTISPECIES: excinuclease ATPase subunit [unclassified Duganella]|jgi:uncharacterized protein YbjQ (UPF0145 family)|uniref:excinuclease ATPase subunit n=1 Tax=unclassified Duganella TaxID=2636909 RepID=UPI00087F4BB8|nr:MULTISPECIES: excinuclease ATPase subunit [unclassified Duganella]SDF41829.1 hypothetical protein SAMN05216320_101130 [Duganella sp. OV458]SDI84752.1 hypothetical protein SAMN05428973_1011293 [Duganella sp. OV510]
MKKKLFVAALLAASFSASAADTMIKFPIAGAMSVNDAEKRLDEGVKFYFAGQPTPKVLTKVTSDKTSQRTNSFGKSAEKACNWVFLSAMLALQKRAQEVGANAVINIVSNYKDVEMASATEFECAEGAIMAGVALKADFVKVAP